MKPTLFTGNSNVPLAEAVAKELWTKLGDALVAKFNDGETRVRINQTVRGQKVFVLQSTCDPVNDNLMEILLMADALKRSSAEKIVAVIPYFGYSRQDYQMSAREPITSRLVADLLQQAGVTSVVTVDMHSSKAQGFFSVPFDNLKTTRMATEYLSKEIDLNKNIVVVSPDAGGVSRTQYFAARINAPIAIIHKRRPRPGEAKVMSVIGDVEGKNCLLVDDMIDTGGSLIGAADALKEKGAKNVYAYCTHAVLSGDAVGKIEKSKSLEKLFVTDTIPLKKKSRKIKVFSTAPILAKAISAIYENVSISPYVD
ncbi:ribose-phosphate pyrophosphokinase [Candidatus Micrarchaeota archaeon]|nr:ribose-phosphate pyrophosphokinase [Candidatus Micrarchaeota archaeon]